MIASSYAYAAAADPDKLPYDLSFFKTSASIVGTSMAAWLAHRRSKAALPVACATAVGAVALGVANKVKKGAYVTRTWAKDSLKERVFNKAMPIAHAAGSAALVGLTVASRIRANKNNLPTLQGPLLSSPWYPLARKLGLYFMSFSLLGHWVEILFCLGIKHGILKGGYDRENHMLWDQWLFPFPAEGTAAVLADLALVPAKSAIQKGVSTLVDAGRIPFTWCPKPRTETPLWRGSICSRECYRASFFDTLRNDSKAQFWTDFGANSAYGESKDFPI